MGDWSYVIGAYSLTTLGLGLYVFSLFWRRRAENEDPES